MTELQEREAQAPRAQLSDRECQDGPQQQHLWFNVEKTFGVTGTDCRILQVSALPVLGEPGAVGQLDDAEPQVAGAE